MYFCLYPKKRAYFLQSRLKSEEEAMALSSQTIWSKLTEAQRTRIVALLTQMLLRQLTQRQEVKPA
jgi:hypothetical protein